MRAPGASILSFPAVASLGDQGNRSASAVSPTGSLAAPLIANSADAPLRKSRALAGIAPLVLASATKFFSGLVVPRRLGGDGATSRREWPRITFARFLSALSSLNFFHRFPVSLFQQAAEFSYPIHGDVPNVPPGLRRHLGSLPLHENHHGETGCDILRGHSPQHFAENGR